MSGPGDRKGGANQCKICGDTPHPGRQEIDAMLLNGKAGYADIIRRMKAAHPGAPELNPSNLSRHKKNHLMTKPIKITEADPETGLVTEGYIIGHLSQSLVVPKGAVPAKEDRIGIEDALWVIINAGIRNAVMNPDAVTMKDVIAALELARKWNIKPEDGNAFDDAWKALGQKKASRTKTTKVTVEETLEEDGTMDGPAPTGEVVEGTVVPPGDGWSADDLLLLEGPKDGDIT